MSDRRRTAGARFPAPVTWRVKITNLTRPGSPPLSRPMFAVHRSTVRLWDEGDPAALVENAGAMPGVVEAAAKGRPIPPGASARFTVRVRPGHRVSIVLVDTNDAVTGVDGLALRGNRMWVRTHPGGPEAGPVARIDFVRGS